MPTQSSPLLPFLLRPPVPPNGPIIDERVQSHQKLLAWRIVSKKTPVGRREQSGWWPLVRNVSDLPATGILSKSSRTHCQPSIKALAHLSGARDAASDPAQGKAYFLSLRWLIFFTVRASFSDWF